MVTELSGTRKAKTDKFSILFFRNSRNQKQDCPELVGSQFSKSREESAKSHKSISHCSRFPSINNFESITNSSYNLQTPT